MARRCSLLGRSEDGETALGPCCSSRPEKRPAAATVPGRRGEGWSEKRPAAGLWPKLKEAATRVGRGEDGRPEKLQA
jgi:hypothetical protein